MAIRFMRDYRVAGSSPPEVYTAGQIVADLAAASEEHFVRRGAAAFVEAKADFDGMTVPQLEKYAEAHGIDLPEEGTGKNGAVLKSDIIKALQ